MIRLYLQLRHRACVSVPYAALMLLLHFVAVATICVVLGGK